jgi:CHAD domain-containing protein
VLTGDDARSSVDVVRAALAPRLSLAPSGRPRTLRQTWLDTFDWRLYQAGFSLEHRTGSRLSDYLLSGGAGEPLTASASSVRWPALAGALPPGPLRDRLAGLAWIRALLPVARATSTVRQLRLLNDDLKTIALLTVSQLAVAGPAAAPLPARLSVTAIRGYQAQTDRVIRELAETAGLSPATCSALETALAAAGRQPGDYTGKVDVQLTAAMPARRAVTEVLVQLAGTLQANVPGTVRDTDTEFLHDLRVAVRRTRSALKLCGDVLTAGTQQRYAGEFKWLGDITTPVRDLEVYLLGYDQSADGLRAASPAELAPFHAHLCRQREAERAALVRVLRSSRFTGLIQAWRSDLAGQAAPRRGPAAGQLAAERIGRAHQRVLGPGARIMPGSPPESLHDLRKRCKELRYLLEFFASLHDPAIHRQAVRELKGLQDCLGEYQDCQVQLHELRMFAGQMRTDRRVPATALLAMGELAGHIAQREHRARSEFAGRFADFASAANQQRFRALTAGALA